MRISTASQRCWHLTIVLVLWIANTARSQGGIDPFAVAVDPNAVAGAQTPTNTGGLDPNAVAVDPNAVAGAQTPANTGGLDPNAVAGAQTPTNTGGLDPNAVAVDPNAVAGAQTPTNTGGLDPNAVAVDPNAVAAAQTPANTGGLDPNAVAVDPNAVAVDPNAVAVDPNAVAAAQTPANTGGLGSNVPGGKTTNPLPPMLPPSDPVPAPAVAPQSPPENIPVDSSSNRENGTNIPGTPPGPPLDWQVLPLDKTIIFGMEIKGPSLVPWTKTKSWVFVNVLHDPYLMSCDIQDIEAGVLDSYRGRVPARKLLQTENGKQDTKMESGIQMKVLVHTNTIRVESEVSSIVQAVNSGSLASDLSMALGSEVSNVSLVQDPQIIPFDSVADPNASTGGSLPGWIIGAIVGGIIILIPIPAYILYKRSRKKHIEALAKQQAEAAAARQRMQSRIIKSTGGKSFSTQMDPGLMDSPETHDIFAQSAQVLYTPGSISSARQNSGVWNGNSSMEPLRTNSNTMTPRGIGYDGSSPTRAWQQQQQRALYQQNSLGPGGMPSVNRVGSFTRSSRYPSGSVYPVRYSDEASTSNSSANLSEPTRP